MTFEITTMSANLATKLTVAPGVFVIATRTPVTIKVTSRNREKSGVPRCQCNTVQHILLPDYRTFRKYKHLY